MDLCRFTGYKMVRFSVGTRVEVMGHSDGFLNSYFDATVICDDQDKVFVRYEELIDDDGEKLEEQVKIEHIRLYPSKVEQKLNEGDDVDAFDGAGWWRGMVVLECRQDLVVYFSYMTQTNERHHTYGIDDVRIHQECLDIGGANAWLYLKVEP